MQAPRTSDVIAFPLDRVRPPGAGSTGADAEVLMFTGVRVERLHDLAERLPPARTGAVSNARMDVDLFW